MLKVNVLVFIVPNDLASSFLLNDALKTHQCDPRYHQLNEAQCWMVISMTLAYSSEQYDSQSMIIQADMYILCANKCYLK